jgi:transcriptional regulator GlxA family with amidase domain
VKRAKIATMSSAISKKVPSVCLLALPESSAIVLYGLYEVLALFSSTWAQVTGDKDCPAHFDVKIVSIDGKAFDCVGGIPVTPHAALADITHADIVIVTDLAVDQAADHTECWGAVTPWLQQMYAADSLVCSVCSGSILLAASGLLDNRPATTHWAFIDYFRQFHPAVDLQPNRILVTSGEQDRIVTAGGMASWEDLALFLIARFYGEANASKAAKLFLFGDRSEGQMLFAAMQKPKRHEDAVIANSQQWIAQHYDSLHPVQRMVEHSGLAVRTFKRRFKSATGFTPIDYVQTLRVEEAKQVLESTSTAIDTIARETGYEDPTSFLIFYTRLVGVTPGRYRQRFQMIAGRR